MTRLLAYVDFTLAITRASADAYHVEVVASPAGTASHTFTLPPPDTLELLILKMGHRRGRDVRGLHTPEMEAARKLGAALHDAVFAGDVALCWNRSRARVAGDPATGLRIQLRLDSVPELGNLPWEFLYDQANRRFLAHSLETPVVRHLALAEPLHPVPIALPLAVLVVVASPSDEPALDVAGEIARLEEALGPLVADGLVKLAYLERATLPRLHDVLDSGTYHVLHYIGHGGFDKASHEGVLMLEDAAGRTRLVDAHRLGTALHDHRSLRLVVLNACDGARNSSADPYAGVATTLVQQGVPAVVAMQFAISDDAAKALAGKLYSALARGHTIDAAVAEARKAIYFLQNEIEWGTPVLYTRLSDGVLFSIRDLVRRDSLPPDHKPGAAGPDAKPPEVEETRPDTPDTPPDRPEKPLAELEPPPPPPPPSPARNRLAKLGQVLLGIVVTVGLVSWAVSKGAQLWRDYHKEEVGQQVLGQPPSILSDAAQELLQESLQPKPQPVDANVEEPTDAIEDAARQDAQPEAGAAAPRTIETRNLAATIRLVEIPGGEFTMGSPTNERHRSRDETEHRVRVSTFWMGATEVTQAQWKEVMGRNPTMRETGLGNDRPVQDISWYDAIAFLNKLSEKEGLEPCYAGKGSKTTWEPACNGYRLPTEAEWEYACRAGTQTAYSSGNDASALREYAWYEAGSSAKVQPVGKKKPNAWGLHDMHGNANEWVWDRYGKYRTGGEEQDPRGPSTGVHRSMRGGTIQWPAREARCASRGLEWPTGRAGGAGLRVARRVSIP